MIDILTRNNVRVIGDCGQTMLFANGFGCDQNVWRNLIPAFKGQYQLILFDYVGAGQSDLSAYDSLRYSTLDGYATDILEIIEALSLSDIIFIGHSVSSMIGIRAAIKHPSYFRQLIFVSPSPCYINEESYVGGMDKSDLDGLFTMMDSNYLGWSGTIAPLIMGNSDQPELGDELTANFCATDPDIAREFAKVTFFSDSRADLHNLKVPSLTLQCTQDILAPLEIGYYINQHTPNNKLVILNATGHCPHLSAPTETIRAINTSFNFN
jgi:sigma-B regulation protein RsbQ